MLSVCASVKPPCRLLTTCGRAHRRYRSHNNWDPPHLPCASVPEFWLIDPPGEAIERHTNPAGDTYGVTVRVGHGEEIESTAAPGLVINTDDVLGTQ